MPLEVEEDHIQGAGFRLNFFDGASARRSFLVKGLGKTPVENLLYRAWMAVRQNTGLGVFHPNIPEMVLTDVDVQPVGIASDQARVYLDYRSLESTRIKLNGHIIRETTRFDTKGNVIKALYKAGHDASTEPDEADPETLVEPGEAPIFRAGAVLEFERVAIKNPFPRQERFQGKINYKRWQGKNPHTWFCSDISGQALYMWKEVWVWMERASFTFLGSTLEIGQTVNTWDPIHFYIDPHTRRVPGDVNPKANKNGFPGTVVGRCRGNGYRQHTVIGEMDFNELDYPNVTLL